MSTRLAKIGASMKRLGRSYLDAMAYADPMGCYPLAASELDTVTAVPAAAGRPAKATSAQAGLPRTSLALSGNAR